MKAGRLRHLVCIETPVESANEYGEPIKQWKSLCKAWAGIEPLKGNEKFSAMQVSSEVDNRIVIRWTPEADKITTKDRVVFGGKIYDIKDVLNIDERDREINIMARRHL
jgi:SPP1 family predicted phage head-tail adaptor